jgi:glycosyltransferase involved in cell wall biosynthesis
MPDFLVFSAIIPKIMGARVILDIHDPMPEVFLSKYKEQPHGVILRLIILQEKISCSFANAIITANSNFKANLTNRGIHASKITVINNYPDRDIFDRKAYKQKLQVKREEFILIYPGTIAPRYGLEVPIRSLPELILKIPEICLVIIGQNSKYKDKLMGIADQLGVSSYVQFKPVVPNKEIPSHMAQADIGIYPAQKDPHMDIATPTKVLEFATMGIPIISSRVKIVEEIFGNTSIMFFEPGDVKQFTQCVLRLYENPTLREELVQNADQAFVQKHSWENEFRIYLELLNQLLLGKVANKSRMS